MPGTPMTDTAPIFMMPEHGYATDEDEIEWEIVLPTEPSEDALATALAEHAAITIQTAFNSKKMRREQASRRVYKAPTVDKENSSTSCSSTVALFAMAIATAFGMLSTATPAPALPYKALIAAIESSEVRSLELVQDALSPSGWRALALLNDGARHYKLPEYYTISSLASLATANGVAFASPIALSPPSAPRPPVMLGSWLSPPSTTPLPSADALALVGIAADSSNATTSAATAYHRAVVDLVIALLAAYLVLIIARRAGRVIAWMLGSLAASSPSPTPPTPKAEASSPLLMDWNAFQKTLTGQGYTPKQRSKLYGEYKAKQQEKEEEAATTTAQQRPRRLARAAAADLKPRKLDLEEEEEEPVLAAAAPKPPLTWNALQRRTGKSGFSQLQMSLMWAAHKEGVEGYNQFRTRCAGNGFSREEESAMWAWHKVLGVEGVSVKRA